MLNPISFYLILRPQRLTDSCHVFIHLCLLHSSISVCHILPCIFLFFINAAHISADNLLQLREAGKLAGERQAPAAPKRNAPDRGDR